MKHSDLIERSLVKTVAYRTLIIISTFTIVFLLTGEIQETVKITIIINIANTLLYFLHERLWNRIQWGKAK